nr:CU044_2847 family protein [Streptomyces antibioticus]
MISLDDRENREISETQRVTTQLAARSADIQEAIREASSIAQESLESLPQCSGWGVSGLEVTFGLTLAVEAGVIISKASGEASFEITLSIERTG